VLDNVPAFQLTDAKMENIEKYVRDLGGGLWVIGGSQSYGAGGYYRTALERILPVDMRPPARLDLPHVALLFVIDKSGSMGAGPEGGTKLDLAKAAAIAAADIMNPTDQVGIIGFDAAWDWVLPFRPVGKGEWISEKLAGLQSDGGTDLYKALVEAHRAIAAKQAAIKHVIILSDGLTDKADFAGLGQRMARDGITVSTVSVGNDADVQLMADIGLELGALAGQQVVVHHLAQQRVGLAHDLRRIGGIVRARLHEEAHHRADGGDLDPLAAHVAHQHRDRVAHTCRAVVRVIVVAVDRVLGLHVHEQGFAQLQPLRRRLVWAPGR
jgi:Mg-chelatase subunit ChlD